MPRPFISASAVIAGVAFWLTFGFILLCLVLVASADIYYVSSAGVWKSASADGQPGNWQQIATFSESDTVVFEGGNPKDPDDDGGKPTTLEQRTRRRAAVIGEPNVSNALSANFNQFGQSMADGRTTWENAVAGTKSFNDLVLSRSEKRQQWELMLNQTYAEMDKAPHQANTMLAVARGLKQGAGTQVSDRDQFNFGKLILCLPCIIDAFASPPVTGAIDGLSPTLIPLEVKSSVEDQLTLSQQKVLGSSRRLASVYQPRPRLAAIRRDDSTGSTVD